ncbi:MAG: hypothetical protein AABX01_04105 [Candidatus Micrarchaeota archaeon]
MGVRRKIALGMVAAAIGISTIIVMKAPSKISETEFQERFGKVAASVRAKWPDIEVEGMVKGGKAHFNYMLPDIRGIKPNISMQRLRLLVPQLKAENSPKLDSINGEIARAADPWQFEKATMGIYEVEGANGEKGLAAASELDFKGTPRFRKLWDKVRGRD